MSPYTIAAFLCAYRFEIGDIQYGLNRSGISLDEMAKLTEAVACLKKAEECLKSFRFIKKVEDLPETPDKPVKQAKK